VLQLKSSFLSFFSLRAFLFFPLSLSCPGTHSFGAICLLVDRGGKLPNSFLILEDRLPYWLEAFFYLTLNGILISCSNPFS
jgi:hypothetical protein